MNFKEVLLILRPYKARMAIIIILSLFISAISAMTPFISKQMVDEGILQGNVPKVVEMVIAIILLQFVSLIIEYLQRRQEIVVSNSLSKKMKTEAFAHGLKLKPDYYKDVGFYKMMGDAFYDISNILSITDNSFLTIAVIVCKCIGAAIGLVILDWRLAAFVSILIPIKIIINVVMRKRAQKLGEHLMDVNKEYNTWYSNIIQGILDIKLWNLESKMSSEYANHVEAINKSSKKLSLLMSKDTMVAQGVEHVILNSLYIIAAMLIASKQLTYGGLTAFVAFTTYLLSPVNIIMHLRVVLKQIAPSVEGLKRFHAMEEENYASLLPPADKISTIEFRNVSLILGGREILKNINLKINKGEKIAIIGDNGSGKTTIINLLLRIYEPTEGEILIDGINASEYNVENYRKKFSVVSQDIHLFKGTIRDNIALAGGDIQDFYGNSRLSFCTETIENWENGYDTQVGIDGTKLSGGEKQKIAFLRALSRKAEILVLDEATANYDAVSDNNFNEYIKENMDYDFYFIVTHRRGILDSVDKVLTMENGNLIKQ